MRKRDELANPASCLNKATDDELLFVLRGHDPAAPYTIRMWAEKRVRMGKNTFDDPQIAEAFACADLMEKERL